MNRLLTFEGRQPIWLDDLDFMQDSVKEEFQKLIHGLWGGDPESRVVIICGCEATVHGNQIEYTSGIISFDGEILYVPEATLYDDDGEPCFLMVMSYDTDGDRLLLDSSEDVSCYQKRTAEIVPFSDADGSGGEFYSVLESVRLSQINDKTLFSRDVTSQQTTGHLRLVRNGNLFLLQGSFIGNNPTFSVTFASKEAYERLAISGTNRSGMFWKDGETLFPVAIRYSNHDDADAGVVFARASCYRINQYQGTIQLDVVVDMTSLNIEGYEVEGGFNVILNQAR